MVLVMLGCVLVQVLNLAHQSALVVCDAFPLFLSPLSELVSVVLLPLYRTLMDGLLCGFG